MMQSGGTGFLSGVSAGFFGSLGASTWGKVVGDSTVGMIAFGALSGGVGASLTGGNFLDRAVVGGIVAGLNDAMHKIDPPGGKKQKYYDKKPKHNPNSPLQEHYNDAVTLSEWSKANDSLTRDQIINQSKNKSLSTLNSQQGGPKVRYVFHPKTGNVIDKRQMIIMGNYVPLIGNMVEVGQKINGLESGLNIQDFYSNSLGYEFYGTYNTTGVQLLRFLGVGANFSSSINSFLNR